MQISHLHNKEDDEGQEELRNIVYTTGWKS